MKCEKGGMNWGKGEDKDEGLRTQDEGHRTKDLGRGTQILLVGTPDKSIRNYGSKMMYSKSANKKRRLHLHLPSKYKYQTDEFTHSA